jgi:hypothetical protein
MFPDRGSKSGRKEIKGRSRTGKRYFRMDNDFSRYIYNRCDIVFAEQEGDYIMEKKVYCKNCRYYKVEFIYLANDSSTSNCFHISCFNIIDTPEEKKKERIRDNDTLNKKNNCKYYHRKFWKFWVK